jgi:hypothetical protein
MSTSKNRSKLAASASLLAGAAVALLANLAIAPFLLPRTSFAPALDAYAALRSLRAPADWIVLGDSTGYTSVRPDSLCPALGVSCVDLATVGDFSLVEDAWLLELYLRRFPAPKKVVIARSVVSYGIPPTDDLLEKALDVDWRDSAGLAPFGLPLFSAARLRWAGDRIAPCYFMGGEIASLLMPRLALSAANPEPPYWRAPGYAPISDGNQKALETIAELARTRGFSLDFVESPVSEELLRDPGDAALRLAVEGRLEAFCGPRAACVFVRGLPDAYPPALMKNGRSLVHLGKQASEAFSARLLAYYRAANLRPAIGESRRVTARLMSHERQ